ncbi:hypothetical protein [Solemya velum gill symbiont]|nr:hypothetical protein [Solemya velum gill symbiont]
MEIVDALFNIGNDRFWPVEAGHFMASHHIETAANTTKKTITDGISKRIQ